MARPDAHPLMPAVIALTSVVGLAWVVIGIGWMHRARSNADRLRPGGPWGPGWAVGAWFVPLAYLALGFLVMKEIWQRTTGAAVPTWVVAGWALWSVPLGLEHALGFQQGRLLQLGLPAASMPAELRLAFACAHLLAAALFTRYIAIVGQSQDAAARPGPDAPPSMAARTS